MIRLGLGYINNKGYPWRGYQLILASGMVTPEKQPGEMTEIPLGDYPIRCNLLGVYTGPTGLTYAEWLAYASAHPYEEIGGLLYPDGIMVPFEYGGGTYAVEDAAKIMTSPGDYWLHLWWDGFIPHNLVNQKKDWTPWSPYTLTALVTVTNRSTKLGQPSPALLFTEISVLVGETEIGSLSEQHNFAANESYPIPFAFTIHTWDQYKSGQVLVAALDPSGRQIASGAKSFST